MKNNEFILQNLIFISFYFLFINCIKFKTFNEFQFLIKNNL